MGHPNIRVDPAGRLKGLLASLDRVIADPTPLTVAEAVALGAALWRIGDKARAAIEPLKGIVKTAAEAQHVGGPGSVRLTGPNGTHCTVTFQEPQPKLRKDAELGTLRFVLGDLFGDLFSERPNVQPRKNFKQLVTNELGEVQAKAVRAAVDMVEGQPRFSFGK